MWVSKADEFVAAGSVNTSPSLELWAEMTEMVGSNWPFKNDTPRMFVMCDPSTVGSGIFRRYFHRYWSSAYGKCITQMEHCK
jgi:hypothetical protein